MDTEKILGLIKTKEILERTFRISGRIDDSSVHKILEKMMSAFFKDTEKEIVLWINSSGGETSQAISFYDTVKIYQPKLITIATGSCMSAAIPFLLAGDKEMRMATKRTQFLIHPTRASSSGTMDEMQAKIESSRKFEEMITEIITSEILLPKNEVDKLKSDETRTSVEDALQMGLISHII